jgi:hypothetical protein
MARVFVGAGTHEPQTIQRLREIYRLNVNQVSAGDIARDGRRLVLRTENRGWLWERAGGESIEATLRRPPQILEVRGPDQARNGEAIAFHPGGNSYFTISEGQREFIYQFPLPPVANP